MEFGVRISRIIKSYVFSPYRTTLNLIIGLSKPVSPNDFLDEKEVLEVLRRGMSRREEYMAISHFLRLTKDNKDYRDKNFSLNDLLEMSDKIGVPREFVRFDLKSVKRNQDRRKGLRENLKAFIIFQTLAVTIGIVMGGSMANIKVVGTAWSIAILIQYLNIREAEASETARAFQKWMELEKIESDQETP